MARLKKTDPKAIPEEEIAKLPKLSPQEMAMLEAFGQGNSRVDSYAGAFGRGGYSQPALRVQASRKFAEPHIQAWLDALQRVGFANAILSRADWLEEGRRLMFVSEASGNMGAAANLWRDIGKSLGYISETEAPQSFNPLEALDRIHAIEPAVALRLADQHKIAWRPPAMREPIEASQ